MVRQDPKGRELVIDAPRLSVVREHRFGGMVDTRIGQYCGPSRSPVVWYCSEAQEPLLLHSGDLPPRLLVFGAEGAGKTFVLAMYAMLRCLEHVGSHKCFGATAPTGKRLRTVTTALRLMAPPEWYTWHEHHQEMRLVFGPTIQCVATKRHSEAIGSPVQGFSWPLGSVSDELQDSMREDPDIETRGRGAKDGIYRRLCTATAKDSAVFRTFLDDKKTSDLWGLERLEGRSNAFVAAAHWDNLKLTLSPRDYQRRVLAMMVGPERATYPSWDREQNLRPIPQVGVMHSTSTALGMGSKFQMLGGHDPGQIQDVTLLLQRFTVLGERDPLWWVVDEITTKGTTAQEHGEAVIRRLREKWHMNTRPMVGNDKVDPYSNQVHIRVDPYGDNDQRTDVSTYRTMANLGLSVQSAAFTKAGSGKGRVPKDAGIEMINRLFYDASGRRRLFVGVDDRGMPVAPRLVEALETSERDEHGKAEVKVKGKMDWSHWPASLRYALWPYERVVTSDATWQTGSAR